MPGYNPAMRNSITDHIAAQVAGGVLTVMDAANVVLATHSTVPSFPPAANGTTSVTTIPNDVIDVSGIATKVRVTKGGIINEYTVAAGEVTFGDNNYVVGGESRVTNLTIAYPTGGL
jgi:hypothetical protein